MRSMTSRKVTVVRLIGQRLGVQHEQATSSPAVVGDDGGLYAELVRRASLPAALTLLFRADLDDLAKRKASASSSSGWSSILRRMSRTILPSRQRRIRNCG